jgi:hypothetical protein
MLPGVDPTGRRTAAVALRHIAFLLPLGAVAAALQVGLDCYRDLTTVIFCQGGSEVSCQNCTGVMGACICDVEVS